MKVKKIIHCGDLHLFRSKRFNEHEYLFNKFIEQIEIEKPDLVVIAGDIIDSKVNISTEQVILLRSFLYRITCHCPIIQILGNHDLNLANKERKDLVSAIIKDLIDKEQTTYPIHFYPHSGIYNQYGINWAVWSCLDDQKNPFDENICDGYTIGLYHGSVKGCISDNGMRLSEGIDISAFDKCNVVMMADIHFQQFFRNNEIGFSGGFIQVKENEQPHGSFLIWEWNGLSYIPTVRNLDNEFSTLTYKVTDVVDLPVFDKIYDNQIIKLEYDKKHFSKADIIEYKKKIQKKYSNKIEIKPIVFSKNQTASISEKEKDVTKMSFEDLLKLYLEKQSHNLKNFKSIDEDYPELLKLDKEYTSSIDTESSFEIGNFYFEKIIINNLYSFGPEDTEIDLFSVDGINGIVGENRSGKSSIIKSLLFTLYGSIPETTTSNKKIINKHNRSKSAYGEVYINKEGKRYKIKHTIIPKKTDNVSFELIFDEIDENNDIIRSLNGEKKQETQKNIQKYFGLEETFELLSMFSAQKKQIEFIDCKNAKRLEYVNKFMGLQNYEIKHKNAGVTVTTDKKIYEELLKEFNSNLNLDDLEAEKEECNEEIVQLNQVIDTNKNELVKIQESLNELTGEYQKYKLITETEYEEIDVLEFKIEKKKKEIKQIEDSKLNKQSELNLIEEKRKDFDKQIEEIKKSIDNSSKEISEQLLIVEEAYSLIFQSINIEKPLSIITDFSKYFDYYKNDLKEINNKIAIIKSDRTKLFKQLEIDICSNCSKVFTDKDKEITQEKIKNLGQELEELNTQLQEIETKEIDLKFLIKNYQNQQGEVTKITSLISDKEKDLSKIELKISELNNEIQKIENKYLNIDNEIQKIELLITDLQKKIVETNKILKQIRSAKTSLQEVTNKKQPLEESKKQLEQSVIKHSTQIGSLTEKIKQIDKEIADYKSKFENIKIKEQKLRLLMLYREVIAKDGLPLFILKEKIGAINHEINTIVNQVFDFDLEFVVDEDSGELVIEFTYDDDLEKSDVSMASGSETFIINLCIRVGLSQVSEIPKCLSLIVDEGFGTLDKNNVDKVPLLFTTLLNYYKNIILISHLDEMKDTYTHEIHLQKDKYTVIS